MISSLPVRDATTTTVAASAEPIRIPVALFNYRNGGRTSEGRYDFTGLQRAFADVTEPPALVLFCESKHFRDHGGAAKYAAVEVLSDELGVPYVAELGSMRRGPLPPAIFYNPNILILRRWHGQDDAGVFDDQRNLARFAIRDSGTTAGNRREFLAFVHHFEPLSGDIRLFEARRIGRYGAAQPLPVIGGGDLNATASGDHFPQRDWTAATMVDRAHKGIRGPDGSWGADTRAVDYLIGEWDAQTGARRDGCGFHAIAEMDWRADPTTPIHPTVNPREGDGGGLLIDWLLVNDAMRPHVTADSYQVHLPNPFYPIPSDHRLVTATVEL